MDEWFQAITTLIVSLVAAIPATIVAILAIRRQETASARALEAQARAVDDTREHERTLAMDERLWARRADLYVRINSAMRDHLDRPVDSTGTEIPLMHVPLMAHLASEVDILGSTEAKDIVNEFVFNDPGRDEKINLWSDFTNAARKELATPLA